jgi:hypothetical protein
VLDLSSLDLEEIANALADQTDYEHHWLINPDTGEIAFWTADTGIDGQTPADLDELDLIVIQPLPSWIWYQDMADFADGLTDERTRRRLAQAMRSGTLGPADVLCNGWLTTRSSTTNPRTPFWSGARRAVTPRTGWLAEVGLSARAQVAPVLYGIPPSA